MEELSTKEFNEIYKKYFKEYFDKPLKKDGYYKKGTITFYKINKLMMIEVINFQRYYDRLTVNFGVSPLWCGALKGAMNIGGRINKFSKEKSHWRYQWWNIRNEEEIKNSMIEILGLIQSGLYKWFTEKDNEENIMESLKEAYFDKIHECMFLATAMAKFKRYDEILPYIEKVKKVLFFSVALMGTAFCYAQENAAHNKDVCPKSMLENIEEVDYDCLDILDGRLEKEVDEQYKILYQRVKNKDTALHGLPASYFNKVRKTWGEYKEQLCSDPTNDTDLKSAADWYILKCSIEQSQAHLKALKRF